VHDTHQYHSHHDDPSHHELHIKHDDDDVFNLSFSAPAAPAPPPPAAPPAPGPPPPPSMKKAVAKPAPTPVKAKAKPAPAVAKPKAQAQMPQLKPAQLKQTNLKPVAQADTKANTQAKGTFEIQPLRSAATRQDGTPSRSQFNSRNDVSVSAHAATPPRSQFNSRNDIHSNTGVAPSHSHSHTDSHSHSHSSAPQHQAGHASHGHSQPRQPAPASGDMRNFARQSQILKPSHVGGGSERCHSCNERFDGEYVNAMGRSYHLYHFTCNDCHVQLGTSFYEHKGNPLCPNCAGNLLPCTKCRRGITGQYIIQDGKPFHKECLDKWVCARCHRDVEDIVTNALGKHWHKHCFTCHDCNAPLGGQFIARDGNPICQNCANRSLPKCHSCQRELVGDYTNYDGKGYHNQCFRCGKCNTQLELSGFYSVGGQAVCGRCVH
jgi:hypothetical protein